MFKHFEEPAWFAGQHDAPRWLVLEGSIVRHDGSISMPLSRQSTKHAKTLTDLQLAQDALVRVIYQAAEDAVLTESGEAAAIATTVREAIVIVDAAARRLAVGTWR
jgi:hypothetical protein